MNKASILLTSILVCYFEYGMIKGLLPFILYAHLVLYASTTAVFFTLWFQIFLYCQTYLVKFLREVQLNDLTMYIVVLNLFQGMKLMFYKCWNNYFECLLFIIQFSINHLLKLIRYSFLLIKCFTNICPLFIEYLCILEKLNDFF